MKQDNATTTSSLDQSAPQAEIKRTRKQSILRYWPGLVVIVVILLLAGLYQFTIKQFNSTVTVDHAQHQQSSPHVHEIVHIRQKLSIGVNPSKPPFSFKPASELVGFDIDLGKAIARELNVPVEFVEYNFIPSVSVDGLGDSNLLTQDKVDMVISGITVNRARQQFYSFSKPYLTAGLVAITSSENADIQQSSDLSQKKLGVIEYHSSVDFVRTITSAENIGVYKTQAIALEAINNKAIDALILEAPLARSFTLNNPSTHIATDLLTSEDYAVMTMRDEDDLIDEINNILNQLRQKGVLESLRHKWLE